MRIVAIQFDFFVQNCVQNGFKFFFAKAFSKFVPIQTKQGQLVTNQFL